MKIAAIVIADNNEALRQTLSGLDSQTVRPDWIATVANNPTINASIISPGADLPALLNAGYGLLTPEFEFVTFVQSPTLYHPAKIERSLAVLNRWAFSAAVVSDFQVRGKGRVWGRPFDSTRSLAFDLHGVFRRTVLEGYNPLFEEGIPQVMLHQFFLRIAQRGLIYHLPEVLHEYV